MPSCALPRRDPQFGKRGFSKTFGFTVIELMMAVGVLAIITALALPSYRSIIEKRRVTSAAEQAMAFLSSAQFESVKRNQFVAVNFGSYTADDGTELWCLGMAAGDAQDVTCDCRPAANTCTIDGVVRAFHSSSLNYPLAASSIDLLATDFGDDTNTLRFDPVRGLIVDSETADLALISPDQAMYALNIGLTPTGRVRICTDSERASKTVPGYEACL